MIIRYIWGLGIGDWGLGPIPNPQSPIPNFNLNLFMSIFIINIYLCSKYINLLIIKLILITKNGQ